MDLARPGSRPIKDFYLQNSFARDRLCKISARSKTKAKLQDLNALKLKRKEKRVLVHSKEKSYTMKKYSAVKFTGMYNLE